MSLYCFVNIHVEDFSPNGKTWAFFEELLGRSLRQRNMRNVTDTMPYSERRTSQSIGIRVPTDDS